MSDLFHIESEQSVIGGLLIDPAAFDKIDFLKESDFYREDHRTIYRHIAMMLADRKPVDVVTVAESMLSAGIPEDQIGLAFLGELAANTPSATNIRRYAEVVVEKRMLRDLVAVSDSIAAMAHEEGVQSAADRIDAAASMVFALADASANDDSEPELVGSILSGVLEDITRRHEAGGEIVGLSTGFAELDAKTSGLQGGDLVIVAGRPSMGKAQPLDSKILMDDGTWKRMGDIKFGEYIASIDGAESRVVGIFPQGVKKIYRVTLSDGRSARCCGEHLWSVDSSRWVGGRKTKSTSEIADLIRTERYRNRITVPLVSGYFGSSKDLPIDPWLLGVLLSNGCLCDSVRVSTADASTLFRIQEIVGFQNVKYAGKYDYRINQGSQVESIYSHIKALGLDGKVSQDKFIPDVYMSASRHDRLELLRGFLDTDGWVETFGAVRIALSNETMAKQVQQLVWSLGGKCSISRKETKYTYRGERKHGMDTFTINIQHEDRSSLLTLLRKKRRCKDDARFCNPTIVSIVEDGEEDAQCIKVSHESSLYVTDNYIVTHNTAIAINIAENAAVEMDKSVLVFSMEMGKKQLVERSLASIGRIDMKAIRTGQLTDDDFSKMSFAMGKLFQSKLTIDDRPALSIAQMRARARRVARKNGGIDLMVVDYIQLASADTMTRKSGNREQEVSSISRGLKSLAKEFGCPVIALSQLSRKCEERADKRPMMSDLRESGAIEQDADIILMMYRDEYYNRDSRDKGVAEVIIGKQRQGETGVVPLSFVGNHSRFGNLSISDTSEFWSRKDSSRSEEHNAPKKAKRGFE